MSIWKDIGIVNTTDLVGGEQAQRNGRAVQLADGRMLYVWESDADDPGAGNPAGLDVIGQIFDIFGDPVGGEFRLNVARSADDEQYLAITALPNGGFLAAYTDVEATGLPATFDNDVVVERFDADGNRLNGILVHNGVSGFSIFSGHVFPAIAAASNTNAMVVTIRDGVDLRGTIINPVNGNTIAAEFNILSSPDGFNGRPEIEVLADGNYVVAYVDDDAPGNNDDVMLKTFDAATGASIATRTVSSSFADATGVKIAVLTNGDIVATWMVDNTGGSNSGVRARRFDADLNPIGNTFTPPTVNIAANEEFPDVVALNDGGFMFAWYTDSNLNIEAQIYNADGTRSGGQFNLVNLIDPDDGVRSIDLARMEDGRLTVTWTQDRINSSNLTDVHSFIWDPRSGPNTTPANSTNMQMGTTGVDVFPVAAGAEEVYGFEGDDDIGVEVADLAALRIIKGGIGDDTLSLNGNNGTYDFRDATVAGFEFLDFAVVGGGGKTAIFDADQFTQFILVNFDAASSAAERVQIHAAAGGAIDLSALSLVNHEDETDFLILGSTGAETLTGSLHNDIIDGGLGDDTMDGGTGVDLLQMGLGYLADTEVNLGPGTVVSGGVTETAVNFENVLGSLFDDTVFGSAADNSLDGFTGNDTLDGEGGQDILTGGTGDDTLVVDVGDQIGVETYSGGADTDTLSLRQGAGAVTQNMSVHAVSSIEVLHFGNTAGVDRTATFSASQFGAGLSLAARIDGFNNAGATETLRVNMGVITSLDLSGLTFQDWGGQGDIVDINGDGSAETIIGTIKADDISGGNGDDTIRGGLGQDIMTGGGATDTLDLTTGYAAATTVDLTAGTVVSGAVTETATLFENVQGSAFADTITGTLGANILEGRDGNDTLRGGAGIDQLLGGSDDDVLIIGSGDATAGPEFWHGGGLTDRLRFDGGNGLFVQSDIRTHDIRGIEIVEFGATTDAGAERTIYLNAAQIFNDGIVADALLDGRAGAEDTLLISMDVETVLDLSAFNFVDWDAAEDQVDIVGDGEAETITGTSQTDNILGFGGDDALDGGAGADWLIGGGGGDTYFVDNAGDRVTEVANQGTDLVNTTLNSYTLGADFENLTFIGAGGFTGTGNGLANTITGAGAADTLMGGAGADSLIGLNSTGDYASYVNAAARVKVSLDVAFAGDAEGDALGDTFSGIENLRGSEFGDVLRGDSGDNTIDGRNGSDTIRAGGGNDAIYGGGGNDNIRGEGGNDTFTFRATSEAADTIGDFTNDVANNNDDALRFVGAAFGGLAAGTLAANQFAANSTGTATDAAHRFVYDTGDGRLLYDADGSGAGVAVLMATLTGAPVITNADIVII